MRKNTRMSIQVEKLTKTYGSQRALNEVSFDMKSGEIVGFLGPNGAGKSTLMKILTTGLRADSGTARVAGFDVQKDLMEVRARVGYLPENNPLYPHMYVREYLAFQADLYGCPRAGVEAVIEKTGLGPEAHKKIGALSKGYKQRVGLSAAILPEPEVLILDEPGTGLDPNQRQGFRDLIRSLGGERTILLSTHLLDEVESVCQRVLIIHKGELVADRRLDELDEGEGQVLEVEFDYRIEEVLLRNLPDLTSARNLYGFCYELHFSTGSDRRAAVFDFAHDNGLKTLKLQRRHQGLPELFNELTAPH